ncbi:MAG: S24 family peptidase [Gemmatimonadetes bacterium]|nr:S24 family peptidase [Gemmatimonadota bacterium]
MQVDSHTMTQRENDKALDPVRRRLLQLLAANGSNLRTASLAMGRNAVYLHQFIKRGTPKVLGEDDREILAEHLGCRPDLLRHDRRIRRAAHAKPPPPSGPYSAPKGYSAVPEADLRRAAAAGDLEEANEAWLFCDPLVRCESRAKPGDLWMIPVDGDSMEPVLASGDRILIDVSRTVPVRPGIFVIWDGMGLVAKRIEHVPLSDPPKVVLKSLNPAYDSHECLAEEIRVVGRPSGSPEGYRVVGGSP